VLGAYGRCEGRDLYRVTPAVQGWSGNTCGGNYH
jgi:hypothetical protein